MSTQELVICSVCGQAFQADKTDTSGDNPNEYICPRCQEKAEQQME